MFWKYEINVTLIDVLVVRGRRPRFFSGRRSNTIGSERPWDLDSWENKRLSALSAGLPIYFFLFVVWVSEWTECPIGLWIVRGRGGGLNPGEALLL